MTASARSAPATASSRKGQRISRLKIWPEFSRAGAPAPRSAVYDVFKRHSRVDTSRAKRSGRPLSAYSGMHMNRSAGAITTHGRPPVDEPAVSLIDTMLFQKTT